MKGAVHTLPLGPGATLGKTKKKKAASLQTLANAASARNKKTGFADILRQKLDVSTDRMRKAAETAIGLLKESNPPAASALEKAFRKIMDDSSLSARQKAARLKTLLDQAGEGGVMVGARMPDHGAQIKKAAAAPSKQDAGAVAGVSTETSKKAEKTKVFVWDLRKNAEKTASQESAGEQQRASKDAGPLSPGQALPERDGFARKGDAPAVMAGATPAERIQEMTGSDFAKTAGIILKDGGGEIRLVLKPESLGSVRVRLNIADNRVDGLFIVDTPSAKQIVEGNLDSIMQALTAEGFQTASLSVSVGGGNTGAENRQAEVPQLRRVESLQGFSGTVPDVVELPGWDELLVNLFA